MMRVSECSGGAISVDFLINQFQKKHRIGQVITAPLGFIKL
ncbi:MAG: Uncharacterised protein [Gammaproteobacteria bacterium]|nr:MAG: Uncharacterised protein [Gammaproteobacteria bacterium]|tara:strand:- start:356 stop:478 length:123 start_codon:yes stop_codon:yes gene_type:complete